MEERLYWLGFSVFPNIGPGRFSKLLEYFGSAKNAWKSPKKDLQNAIGELIGEKFDRFRSKFSIEDYVEKLKKNDASFLILTDKEYPQLLKQIPNPPFVLYYRGSMNDTRTIAVVGSRKMTSYGTEVTKLITQELVLSGFTIISGLALGVDAFAHKTTLENGGKTIAVLGCGVDCCYPQENQRLYDQILESGGAIVSEFPLSQLPNKGTFPSRNRIISGLSLGIVVTEGAEDSGSLITADYAFKQNRKVFAVPGPITSGLSKGPYKLIEKGAKLVTKGEDILKEFQISNFQYPRLHLPEQSSGQAISNKKKIKGATKEEQKILDLLVNEPLSYDELVRKSKMNSSEVGSLLSIMEIKGLIQSLNDQFKIV